MLPRVLIALAVSCCLILTSAQEVAPALTRIEQATVFISQIDSGSQITRCIGSGTIVRPDGIILTNAHHVVRSGICSGDTIIISLTLEVGRPPVPKYRAEIAQANESLDLALLRITSEFDGRAIDPLTLPVLPFVDLGDSSQLQLDDTVTFVGYPDLGNSSVTSIRGTLRGFVAEPSGGDRSWIKTASVTPVSGVMSGGGVYNESGQLVGIPTSAPTVLQALGSSCTRIEDVNRDGLVNDLDACIPIGDNVSVLRPSEFARLLIRSASLGLTAQNLTTLPVTSSITSRPLISGVFSSPSVVDGIASTVVSALPAGTTSHYLFFDYANMTRDTVFEMRVTVDGIPNDSFSLPAVKWSGGTSGVWYVGSAGQPYPNGTYEFRIFVDGVSLAAYPLVIGGLPSSNPSFSNVVFGLLSPSGQLTGNGYVLPTGAIATTRFIYANMTPELSWTAIWYYDNREIARATDVWTTAKGANGTDSVSLQPEGGLPTGTYRVNLYIGSVLASSGDFVIAGALREDARPLIFSNLEFIRSTDTTIAPDARAGTTFPDGANVLFVRFDWQQLAPGTNWRLEWLVDDNIFYTLSGPWNAPENGDDFTLRLTAPGSIPDGSYSVRLYVNNVPMISASASVGIGQLRIDRFATASGISLRGHIYDSETGIGIPGVTFVIISADFSIADFTWSQDQVYALAVSDRNGDFLIDRPLVLGDPYSVLISAVGYLPLSVDGFELDAKTSNPLNMNIPLTRD